MKIIILGGVGTAVSIAEQIIDARNNYNSNVEFLGFAVDDPELGKDINGYPVLCKTREVMLKYRQKDVKIIFSLYKPEMMKERIILREDLNIPQIRFATFIHPSVFIAGSIKLGYGDVILSNTTINHKVVIGNFNIINSNIVIEHETCLGNSNFIAASTCIGSKVKIGSGNFIGMNSTLRENVELADYVYIGMGSNVLKDCPASGIYFGNPCRLMKR